MFTSVRALGRLAGEVVAETLWPTRCALCDVVGSVLCDECAAGLPLIDWWKACPRCGSDYGLVQCHQCNPVALANIGRSELPFAGHASAVSFSDDSGQIVRTYKDLGERRLAGVMAGFMARAVVPEWAFDAVTFVPATRAAVNHRGFDHAEELAREVASLVGAPLVAALERPRTVDQRGLGGAERIANLNGRFRALGGAAGEGAGEGLAGARLLVVDDVFTTGATMCAASDALLAGGAECAYGLTFARV